MSTITTSSDVDPEVVESSEIEFDNQLFALSAFVLISLILLIILLFTGVANIGDIGVVFRNQINNGVAEIQALLPPALRAANKVLNTMTSLATNVLNSVVYAIVQGSIACLNVILAVGGTMVETLVTSAQTLTGQLQDIGAGAQVFFKTTFDPLVTFVANAGDTIILFIGFIAATLSPLLTVIGAIFRAIGRIGTLFT